MSFIKKCGLTLFAAAAFQTQAASVWKVSSGDHVLYLGGTIHILTPEDYPLPQEYEEAYKASDKVVFETDVRAIDSHDFQQSLISQLSYHDGTTIEQVLSPQTYDALERYLDDKHIPIQRFTSVKPSLLAMSLSVMELQTLGFTSEGVDQYFSNRASQDHKRQAWLETPQDQIAALEKLGEGNENQLIEYTLQDIKDMPNSVDKLRENWREGNMIAMANDDIADFKQHYPAIYKTLLVDRNNRWLPQIQTMLHDSGTEFVMVGAMHLAGPDGLLKKLANRGYKIEKL